MILAIVQARTSSTRLPKKVLLPLIDDKSLLGFQLDRIKKATKLDKVVLATSTSPEDDVLETLALENGIECYRGSLNDVLDRYYQAALGHQPSHIIRITGDCPLMDPALIDDLITMTLEGDYDYVCNTHEPTYPDGLDLWMFKAQLLEEAWKKATRWSEREHVTLYFRNHFEKFKSAQLKNSENLSHLRWTVDEPKDYELVKKIVHELYPHNPEFSYSDVLHFLDSKPELKTFNTEHKRDEGLAQSLASENVSYSIEKSLHQQQKAKKYIAGENHLLSKRWDQFSEGVWPGYYHRARGAVVWDLDDNPYVDMSIGGIGATVLGYAHHEVDRAVTKALREGVSSSLNCPEEVELAEKIISHHPWAQKARFTRSGGEAMASAVRLARATTQKDKIAFCGYHGWHDWYLASNLKKDNLGGHLLPGLHPKGVPSHLVDTAFPFEYNKIEQLKNILTQHGHEMAAIVMEPIRNSAPLPGFLEEVKQLAKQYHCALIFDEISAGYRLCVGGSHKLYGITPDMAVFSKAIGNGYAISAVIGTDEIMKVAHETFMSSTNWTERVGFAAGLKTLEVFERDNIHERLIATGEKVQQVWKEAAQKFNLQLHVGGIPPLSHFSFEEHQDILKAYFVQEMQKEGILASTVFYAMNSHLDWHIRKYQQKVQIIFEEISKTNSSEISRKLRGKPAALGFKRLL